MPERRKSCCDEIITVINEQKNIEERLKNLETLYKPVNRLSTLFIICTFLLGTLLGAAAYLFSQVGTANTNIARILESNESIKEDIKEIKASSCIARDAYEIKK